MGFIKCGVIGHPIAHSKSPIIHNHWIQKHGLAGNYTAIDIAPDDLHNGIQRLIDENYAGFNVTVPHKQSIFALCHEVDDTARMIGAVNTVSIRDGKLHGTNTDAYGFIENIRQSIPAFDFAAGMCVVLGAGGAARAVVHGLLEAGATDIVITNRTEEKSKTICAMDDQKIMSVAWDDRSSILKKSSMLINTTSLGMTGKDPLEIDLSALPKEALVTDIVYAPLMTDLLMSAQLRGNPVVTGIGMLLHQARPAFEKWFGVLPDVDEELQHKVLR
jgi:shikimate dehydrogenase